MKMQQPLIDPRNPRIGHNLPSRRALLSCLGFALLIVAHSAVADSFVWTGGGGNTNWNNPANWQNVTPGGTQTVPGGSDSVTFSTGATVSGDGIAHDFSIGGAVTLSIAPNSVRMNAGTTNNQGKITFSGSKINDETLLFTGVVTLNGGGEVQLINTRSKLTDFSGATVTNVDNLIHGGNGGSINLQIINSGNIRADSGVLTLNGLVDSTGGGSVQIFSGATLSLNTNNSNTTIIGGTFSSQAGSLVSGSGTLNGVTHTGTTTIASGSLRLLNNTTNQGKITFSGSNINNETLLFTGAVTLNGGGEVQLVNSRSRLDDFSGATLTNADNLIHGGNGGSINLQMINTGIIRADSGTLILNGLIDSTGGGSVEIFNGATLALNTNNSNTTIIGGTFSSQSGSFVTGSGTLNGVTHTGTTTIASGSLRLLNNTTNQGKITFSGSNINNETLLFTGAVTLTGGGEVQLVNSRSRLDDFSGATLTNADNLIHGGNGSSINLPMINSGNIFADNGTLNMTGTLSQTGTGTISVLLNGPNFSTSGLLAASNVNLAGTLKLVVGGTFSASVGSTYRIITANTLNGTTFATIDQSMTNGSTFAVTYGANFVDVTVVTFVPPTPTPTPPPATPTPTASATPPSTPSPTPPASPTPTVGPSATPSATPASGKLGNISTRLRVETGDNVLIGGFIVTGTQPKRVILRAIGPSLTAVGVPDALANPTLELHDSSGLLASNDNWMDAPNRQEIIDTTIAPTNDFESAILMTLPANSSGYTAIVRGVNNSTGVGLVEAYDLDLAADSKLANISTRGFVQTGDNVMIGGFIAVGQASTRVIVRAIGPSLPVAGALADPTLELRDGNGALLQLNDNWRTGGQEAEIIATTIPPSNDLESAVVRTLDPGAYTVIVRGVNNGTGVGLIEVYDLGPP